MPFIKIWIHAVWGTKNRYPYLTKEIRGQVISHIKKNAREKEIYIKSINGYNEHLHCLLRLNADTSIAKTIQLIKGESAFWINKHNITKEKFEWAREYYAASVSESHLDKLYILRIRKNITRKLALKKKKKKSFLKILGHSLAPNCGLKSAVRGYILMF